MKLNKHKCIKCGKGYQSSDLDAYLCEGCNADRQAIAHEVDKRIGSTVGQIPNSRIKSLEELAKSRGKFGQRMDGEIAVSSMAINYKDLL